MILFPAIDIYNNQAVRLKKGLFDSAKVYNDNPVSQAKIFESNGAKWIHVVDLNGAKDGVIHVLPIIKAIKDETQLSIQFGGGIRDLETIEILLKLGIDRIVLGSFALKEPEKMKSLLTTYQERIVVAVDIRDNYVTYSGWQDQSDMHIFDYLTQLEQIGTKYVMITDISKDGMLEGIDVSMYAHIVKQYPHLNIIASGGITTLSDVKQLNKNNLYGAILGVSLYEQKINLSEAIQCSNEESYPV